jgi:hypothetical protein
MLKDNAVSDNGSDVYMNEIGTGLTPVGNNFLV